jgi:hypothetical protein
VLTERDIVCIAQEAEVGYDLTKAKRRHVGRPSLSNGTSPRIQFRIEPELYQRAKDKAASESKTLSEIGRELFSDYAAAREHEEHGGPTCDVVARFTKD